MDSGRDTGNSNIDQDGQERCEQRSKCVVHTTVLVDFDDLVNNPSQGVAAGTQYVLGNTDQSFPAGRATMLNSSTGDIKLVYSDTNISTEPIVDVVVFYKKFDAS